MENTALQEAIELFNSSLKSNEELLLKEPNNAFVAGKCKAQQGIIDYLKGQLPKEREQIEGAWNDGRMSGYSEAQLDLTDYTIDTGGCANSAPEYFTTRYKTE